MVCIFHTYGQTIVFAVSVVHAIQLAAQFNKAGIKADFVVSNTIQSKIEDAIIHKDVLGSDHCPIELDINI